MKHRRNLVKNLQLVELKSSGYRDRTILNAKRGDLTLAIAVNFSTAGERLTAKAAEGSYLGIKWGSDVGVITASLLKAVHKYRAHTLNIAGNGMYTFAKYGIKQKDVNQYLLDILQPVHEISPIECLYSGGQTGADFAAAVVANILEIPCIMTFPKGFKQRGESGVDTTCTAEQIEILVKKMALELKGEL